MRLEWGGGTGALSRSTMFQEAELPIFLFLLPESNTSCSRRASVPPSDALMARENNFTDVKKTKKKKILKVTL